MMISRIAAFIFILAGTAYGQDPLGWNSQRALDLVSRARVRRELPRGDSTLQNYQAKANGYVYFYLDQPGSEERTLVRVDQIALDLYFKRPNLTKQHIVGMRDVNRLPNRMYYHLDHLTVVQNGLGDVIKIGDGDEVRDVPHPAAPGADSIYDYRLADSVTLQLGGDQPSVRVYEIQVRPRRVNRSALIGSIFVDRASADIVRMTFTFTPASYVDRRLDYINISLDNGLFGGRYWLPNEQSVEIRRQIPELDFAAGSVIKGRIHIANYQFNAAIPDSVFYGPRVTAAPPSIRKQYDFPQDIYADLNTEGLAPPPQMEDLRARASELVREKRLSGLPTRRLYIPNASSVLRHDNAEGWYAGLGTAFVSSPSMRVNLLGGYAFGANKPELQLGLRSSSTDVLFSLTADYNTPRDVGPVQGMPGVINTLTSAFGGADYTDTYLVRGVSFSAGSPASARWRNAFFARAEVHRNVNYTDSTGAYQQVRNGRAYQAGYRLTRVAPSRGSFSWDGGVEFGFVNFKQDGTHESTSFGRALGNVNLKWTSEDLRQSATLLASAGFNTQSSAPQYSFLVGGRETLPGYAYRSFAGNKFASVQSELSQTLLGPWLRLRLIGATALTPPLRPHEPQNIILYNDRQTSFVADDLTTSQIRASGGIGVGLLWDVIRVDAVKGREWQVLFSVRRDFWYML